MTKELLVVVNVLYIRQQLSKQGTYLPTKFSSTLDLPADWEPTTAICGRSRLIGVPQTANASCSLFTMGMSCSMPIFPDILAVRLTNRLFNYALGSILEKIALKKINMANMRKWIELDNLIGRYAVDVKVDCSL